MYFKQLVVGPVVLRSIEYSILTSHHLCTPTAFTTWVSLCKHLPGSVDKLTKLYPPDKQSSDDKLITKKVKNMATDEVFYLDYLILFKVLKLMYTLER